MSGRWEADDGSPVSCEEKRRLLDQTEAAIALSLRDGFEDAVLMGVGASFYRARLHAIVDGLLDPRVR